MKSVIDTAARTFGPLNGVIHAAGTMARGTIQTKTAQQAAGILTPKVYGTLVLDQLLNVDQLDFLVLCSSISTVLGGNELSDYSAANAFLDAYANTKNQGQSRPRVISVNWAGWQDVGMGLQTAVPEHLKKFMQEALSKGIHSTEGVEAFTRILANPVSQVIVSPLDLFIELERSKPQLLIAAEQDEAEEDTLEAAPSHSGPTNRPNISSIFVAPKTEIEAKMIGIWEHLLGIHPIGIHDNFFELGGHSLLATQILSRIRTTYRVDLPLRTFFEVSTAAEISKRIEEALWLAQNRAVSVEEVESDREELEL